MIPPSATPDVSIITVSYRSALEVLEAQRTLLEAMPRCEFEWIVVNHSPDDRFAPFHALSSRTQVITQPNAGFGRGVNTAARIARAPFLFLANPDLHFHGDLLDGGLARMAADPDIGAVGPRLLSMDGTLQHSARRFYTWADVMFARVPWRDFVDPPAFWRRHLMMDQHLDHPLDVDWLLGAGLFLRRSALRDPNGPEPVFDPRYFLYFEDVDLAMDLWGRGWRVRYDPTLTATHAHVRASRRLFSAPARHHAASLMKFVQKWGGLPVRPKLVRSEPAPGQVHETESTSAQ
jgi:GT2 family glycosyltransferase